MKRSITARIAIIAIFCFFATQSLFFVDVKAQTTGTVLQNRNNLNLNPFRNVFKSLKFYDGDYPNALIQDFPLSNIYAEGDTVWIPPNNNFPKVQVYLSEPFLVNNQGLNIYGDEETKYIVDPTNMVNTMTKDPVTGSYIYLAKVNVAFDYIIKTIENLPSVQYQKYKVNWLGNIQNYRLFATAVPPFGVTTGGHDLFRTGMVYECTWGYNRQIPNGQTWYTPAAKTGVAGNAPDGVLFAEFSHDVLVYGCTDPVTWHVQDVGISTSLTDFRNPTASDLALKNNFGNKPVRVVANIQTTAYSDMVLYSYYKEVNGQTFLVDSSTTKMGFYDAKLIPSLDKAGKVAAYIKPSEYFTITDEGIDSNPYGDLGAGINVDADQRTTTRSGISSTTYTAEWKKSATYRIAARPGGPIPTYMLGKPTGFPLATTVTASNFETTVPTSMSVTMTDTLQPYSWQHRATYAGNAVGLETYDFPNIGWEQQHSINIAADFPYRMEIENTYIVHRVVMTCLVKSINDILYIPANGQPVDVNDFTDYGINSVGVFNPNMDDAGGSVTVTEDDPLQALLDLFGGAFGPLIIIAIIAIAVIILIVAIVAGVRKGGPGGRPGPGNGPGRFRSGETERSSGRSGGQESQASGRSSGEKEKSYVRPQKEKKEKIPLKKRMSERSVVKERQKLMKEDEKKKTVEAQKSFAAFFSSKGNPPVKRSIWTRNKNSRFKGNVIHTRDANSLHRQRSSRKI